MTTLYAILAGAGVILLAVWRAFSEGKRTAEGKRAKDDLTNIKKIERDADEARTRTGDATDRLRKHGRLRDD